MLERVVNRGQVNAPADLPFERDADQLIGEPWILGQDGTVEVGREDVVADGALGAVRAVVAGSGQDPAERPRPGPEFGQARVVLEADNDFGLVPKAHLAA